MIENIALPRLVFAIDYLRDQIAPINNTDIQMKRTIASIFLQKKLPVKLSSHIYSYLGLLGGESVLILESFLSGALTSQEILQTKERFNQSVFALRTPWLTTLSMLKYNGPTTFAQLFNQMFRMTLKDDKWDCGIDANQCLLDGMDVMYPLGPNTEVSNAQPDICQKCKNLIKSYRKSGRFEYCPSCSRERFVKDKAEDTKANVKETSPSTDVKGASPTRQEHQSTDKQMTSVTTKPLLEQTTTPYSNHTFLPGEKYYSYAELKHGNLKCIDQSRKEQYLSSEQFRIIFGMPFDQFTKQPTWKQKNMKHEKGLM